ncbi:hypothetical protein CRE_29147 [Caenorhabditis remanei]|uniref:Ubiquitin-like protease family profile domain-containing protein n=1 Tax=Caenorhabditis remanei TaxID=31234 RepID=E3N4L8_CAERE|nr:hypothetical protein CRE_29147 [Caenorhabditis remanei]
MEFSCQSHCEKTTALNPYDSEFREEPDSESISKKVIPTFDFPGKIEKSDGESQKSDFSSEKASDSNSELILVIPTSVSRHRIRKSDQKLHSNVEKERNFEFEAFCVENGSEKSIFQAEIQIISVKNHFSAVLIPLALPFVHKQRYFSEKSLKIAARNAAKSVSLTAVSASLHSLHTNDKDTLLHFNDSDASRTSICTYRMVESDGMEGIGYGDDSESSKNRSEVPMDAKTSETGHERWLERKPRRPPKDLKKTAEKEVIIDRIDKNGVNQKLLIFAENQCVLSENNRSEPEISREFLENAAKTWFLWENRAKKLENIDFVFENANFVSGSWKLAPAEREAVSMRDVANESIDRVTIRREELEEGFAGGKKVRDSEFCSDISQVHREVAEEGLYLSSVLSVCLATSTESFYAFEKIEKDKKEKLVFSVELFESFAEEQVSNSSELVGRGKMPVFSVFVSLPCQIIDRKCHKKENGAKIAKNEPNMGNLKRKMQFSMKRPPAMVIRGGAKIAKSEIEKADRIVLVETRGENVVVCQVSIPATRYRCYYKNCFGTSAGGAGAADLQHLTRHLSSVHQKKVEWTYKCSICGEEAAGKSTKATRWVSSHMLEKHGAQHRPRIRSAPTTNQKISDVLKKAAPSLQRPERAVRKGYTAPPVEETTPEKILRVEAMEKMPQTRAVTKSLSVLKESVKKSVKKTEEKQMGKKVFSIFSNNGETSSPASRRLSVAPVRTNSLGSVVDLSNLQGPERVKAAKQNAQITARMETKRRRSSLSVLKPQKVSGKSGKEETNKISEIIPEDSVVSRENDWNESGVLNLTFESDGSNGYVGKRFNTWCLDHEDSREAWLSDEVIMWYLERICSKSEKYKVLDPLTWEIWKIEGIQMVESKLWSSKTYLFPVCEENHWILLIIDSQSVWYANSLAYEPAGNVAKFLKELKRERKYFEIPTPYQKDKVNCGVHVCLIARSIESGVYWYDIKDVQSFRSDMKRMLRRKGYELFSAPYHQIIPQKMSIDVDDCEIIDDVFYDDSEKERDESEDVKKNITEISIENITPLEKTEKVEECKRIDSILYGESEKGENETVDVKETRSDLSIEKGEIIDKLPADVIENVVKESEGLLEVFRSEISTENTTIPVQNRENENDFGIISNILSKLVETVVYNVEGIREIPKLMDIKLATPEKVCQVKQKRREKPKKQMGKIQKVPAGKADELIQKVRVWFEKEFNSYLQDGKSFQRLEWLADSLTAAIHKASVGDEGAVKKIEKRCPPLEMKEGEMSTQTTVTKSARNTSQKSGEKSKGARESLGKSYWQNRAKTYNRLIGKESKQCEIPIGVLEKFFTETTSVTNVPKEVLESNCKKKLPVYLHCMYHQFHQVCPFTDHLITLQSNLFMILEAMSRKHQDRWRGQPAVYSSWNWNDRVYGRNGYVPTGNGNWEKPHIPFFGDEISKVPQSEVSNSESHHRVQEETEENVNKDETKEEIKQEENPKDDVLEEVQQMVANLKILNTTIDNLSKKIDSNQHLRSNVNYNMNHYFHGSRFVMPHSNYGDHHRPVHHPQYGTPNHIGQYGYRHQYWNRGSQNVKQMKKNHVAAEKQKNKKQNGSGKKGKLASRETATSQQESKQKDKLSKSTAKDQNVAK